MNDKPVIAPLGELFENEPTENSSLDELAAYALDKQNGIIASDKKNGEDLWLMGQALEWAYKKTPYGEWEDWFKAKNLKKTWVWQARTLYKKATLDEVKVLGMTEALRKFAVVPDKKPQVAGPKAAGGNRTKEDDGKAVPPSDEVDEPSETPEPSDKVEEPTEAPEPNDPNDGGDQDEADEPGSDDLADEEAKELKAYQESIRKLTPKTRAVAILHALESLLDDLTGGEEKADEELADTFDQIIELAEAAKEIDHDEHAS